MLVSRRHVKSSINIWPGYVDALSALLMLVIFTLLIFTLAQAFLAETLSNRDRELAQLNSRLAEISSLLALEQDNNQQLDAKIVNLSEQYSLSLEKQYDLMGQVDQLTTTVEADKEKIELQLRTLASLQQDILALRTLRQQLEQEVGGLAASLEASKGEVTDLDRRNRSLQTELSGSQEQVGLLSAQSLDLQNRLAGSEGQVGMLRDRTKALQARLADEEERTLLAQEEITRKEIRIQDLFTIASTGKEALEQEKELSTSAQAQVELLNRQIAALREQLTIIGRALKLAEEKGQEQEVQLGDLGKRLNVLLAKQVSELERYRSEFFGRLREALGEIPNIRVVGDRFVFPSELLFASGSANLGEQGKQELAKLALTLGDVASRIPQDVNWILRVDGHTDRQPIRTVQFPSNWELSTARAVSVVRYLSSQGIPARRLAATGFGEFHPVDDAETIEAFQRNRRIEIKLTDR